MEACSSVHHLGAAIAGARFRGEANPARACEALCPAQQKRRGRCGSDLRGGAVAGAAVRAGAVDREPGRADAPSDPRVGRRQRKAALNALPGLLAEIGVVAPQGARTTPMT